MAEGGEGEDEIQFLRTVNTLLKLQTLDSDKCNLVRWYQFFISNDHICLEFEHLDTSLYDFMRDRYFAPLQLKEIRPIVQQLANALDHLKTTGIIHADLKLENIMLVNHTREPYRVKVIDFGLACEVSAATLGSYIQTRPYRSPEIILGLAYTEAVDMWSLGCITATLYLGIFLYPGTSEYDMMRYMVETQGQPPDTMLTLGRKTGWFFNRDDNSTNSPWKLKTPEQFYSETGIQSRENRCMKFTSLYDLMHIRIINSEKNADKVEELNDVLVFVHFLNGMLELDAVKRLTPSQVLKHQFTSMNHMVRRYHRSTYVRSCFELMDLCPPQPGSTTSGSVNSGMKRKADDEDETMSETPHLSKRARSGWHRENFASSSTSSSSQDSGNHMQASTAERTPPAQAHPPNISQKKREADFEDVVHHDVERKRSRRSHEASSTSSSNSCVSQRVKRKRADGDDADNHQLSDHERKRVRKNYPTPPTCNSQASTNTLCVRPDWKSLPSPEHHRHSTHTSSSTQTESRAQSGMKRKAPDGEDELDGEWTSDLESDKKRARSAVC